jgi:hypothetical protein
MSTMSGVEELRAVYSLGLHSWSYICAMHRMYAYCFHTISTKRSDQVQDWRFA